MNIQELNSIFWNGATLFMIGMVFGTLFSISLFILISNYKAIKNSTTAYLPPIPSRLDEIHRKQRFAEMKKSYLQGHARPQRKEYVDNVVHVDFSNKNTKSIS